MQIMVDMLHSEDWLQNNQLAVLAVAALIGLIPESGLNMAFVRPYMPVVQFP